MEEEAGRVRAEGEWRCKCVDGGCVIREVQCEVFQARRGNSVTLLQQLCLPPSQATLSDYIRGCACVLFARVQE